MNLRAAFPPGKLHLGCANMPPTPELDDKAPEARRTADNGIPRPKRSESMLNPLTYLNLGQFHGPLFSTVPLAPRL